MSWFKRREGHEDETREVNPRTDPEKTKGPERPTIEAKEKLNPSERERHDAFAESLKPDKWSGSSDPEKNGVKKKLKPNEDDSEEKGPLERAIWEEHGKDDGEER